MNESAEEICRECYEGQVTPKGGSGRTFLYRRGNRVELPETFAVPTCDKCGEMFWTQTLREKAAAEVRTKFLERQREHFRLIVERLQEQNGCTLRQIEEACGVTPTYLSHVMSGRKEASDPLIGQVEALALYPGELQRRLKRTSSFDTDLFVSAVGCRRNSTCADVAEFPLRPACASGEVWGEKLLRAPQLQTSWNDLESVANDQAAA